MYWKISLVGADTFGTAVGMGQRIIVGREVATVGQLHAIATGESTERSVKRSRTIQVYICRYLLSDHKHIILSTIDLRTKVHLIHWKDSLIERHGQLQLLVVTMIVESCEDKGICYLYV